MKRVGLQHSERWWLVLALLLILGATLRLVNLDAPPLDFHPTRQMRNSLVARAVYFDLAPDVDLKQRGLAESFRHAVGQYEPPIYETLVGATFVVAGGESFAVARIYGTLFWLAAAVALFELARRAASPGAALLGLAYYAVLPFSVQASRSFQPDPLMTSAFVVGLYFLYRWGEQGHWRWAMLGAAFAGLAALVKVVIAFLVAGAAIAIVLSRLGRRFWKSAQVWAMVGVMAAPAASYYLLSRPGRSTEYFFAWTVDLVALITSPHFYADWLGFVASLVGMSVLFLSLVGTALATPRLRWLLLGLWCGYVLYGLVLPFQMFTHSYYHLQLVPIITLGLVPVAATLLEKASSAPRAWQIAAIAPVVVLTVYQGWAARSVLVAEDFTDAPGLWRSIGDAIPEEADVIALTQDYGFDLMYWGWRKVQLWPLNTALSSLRAGGDRDLAVRFADLTEGKDYFLVTAFGQLNSQPALATVLEEFPIAAKGEGYVLYDLRPPE